MTAPSTTPFLDGNIGKSAAASTATAPKWKRASEWWRWRGNAQLGRGFSRQ